MKEFVRTAIDKELFLDLKVLEFVFKYFYKDLTGEIT